MFRAPTRDRHRAGPPGPAILETRFSEPGSSSEILSPGFFSLAVLSPEPGPGPDFSNFLFPLFEINFENFSIFELNFEKFWLYEKIFYIFYYFSIFLLENYLSSKFVPYTCAVNFHEKSELSRDMSLIPFKLHVRSTVCYKYVMKFF